MTATSSRVAGWGNHPMMLFFGWRTCPSHWFPMGPTSQIFQICDLSQGVNFWRSVIAMPGFVTKQLTTAKEVGKVFFDKICPVCQQEFYKTSTKRWSPFQVEHVFFKGVPFSVFPSQPLSRIEFSFVEPDFMATTTLSYTTIPQFCLGITGAYRAVWKILSLGDPFIPQRKIFFTRQCQG